MPVFWAAPVESAAPETVRLLLLLLGAVVVPEVVASPDELLLLEAGVLAEDEVEPSVVPVDVAGAVVVLALGVAEVVGVVVLVLSLGVAGVVVVPAPVVELSVLLDVLGVDDAEPLVGGINTVSIA